MNVQFQHVISDLTGLTGLAILDAIVGGERDPAALAKLRDPRIKADEETIRKSLEGNWRGEHILALKQSCRCIEAIVIRSMSATRKSKSW